MILILLLPAIILAFSPAWMRPWMKLATLILLTTGLVLFLLRLLRGWMAERDTPTLADWRWRPRWAAASYRQHLVNYLEEAGWTILEGLPLSESRVSVVCERGRERAAMLCIRPGTSTEAADGQVLAALSERFNTNAALLVSTPVEEHAAAGITPVPYTQLKDAEAIVGLARAGSPAPA